MTTSYAILGLKDLHNTLQTLPAIIEKKILRSAVLQASNVIKDEAKARAPTKGIRKSINVKSQKAKPGQVVYNTSVAKNKKSFYAKFFEFGTAASYTGKGKSVGQSYIIKPRKKDGFLRIPPNNGYAGGYYKSVTHHGMAAKPFMRPALDAKRAESMEVFKHTVKVGLDMQLGEIRRKRITRKDIKEVFK